MNRLLKSKVKIVGPLRVTPDEAQAEALRRKQAALDYRPERGFHRDMRQDRVSSARGWLRSA